MSFKRKLAACVSPMLRAVPRALGKRFLHYYFVDMEFHDLIEAVDVDGQVLKFLCPTDMAMLRARDLLQLEPETIEWIASFAPGDVFWDVGANVGSYSLIAGLKKCRAFAIEPSPFNYYAMCRNVQLNDLSDFVSPFCVAMHSENRVAQLNMRLTGIGEAGTNFAEAKDHYHHQFDPVHRQPTLGFRLDDFIAFFHLPNPNHLKIDVDGNEDKIIAGCAATLRNPALKSISIELNDTLPDQLDYVHRALQDAGFKFLGKKRAARDFADGVAVTLYNHHFAKDAG